MIVINLEQWWLYDNNHSNNSNDNDKNDGVDI